MSANILAENSGFAGVAGTQNERHPGWHFFRLLMLASSIVEQNKQRPAHWQTCIRPPDCGMYFFREIIFAHKSLLSDFICLQ
jgi:hypothetical protein